MMAKYQTEKYQRENKVCLWKEAPKFVLLSTKMVNFMAVAFKAFIYKYWLD